MPQIDVAFVQLAVKGLENVQNVQYKLLAVQAKIAEVVGMLSGRILTLEGRGDVRIQKPKPANGECPVCATQAPPYVRPMRGLIPIGSAESLIRCAHCSAAFWVDAV